MHYVKLFLTLLTGGLLTSAAEYYIKYNLYDLLKDKVLSLFHKKQASS